MCGRKKRRKRLDANIVVELFCKDFGHSRKQCSYSVKTSVFSSARCIDPVTHCS